MGQPSHRGANAPKKAKHAPRAARPTRSSIRDHRGRRRIGMRQPEPPPGAVRRPSLHDPPPVGANPADPHPLSGASIFEASIHFLPSLSTTLPVTTAVFPVLHL